MFASWHERKICKGVLEIIAIPRHQYSTWFIEVLNTELRPCRIMQTRVSPHCRRLKNKRVEKVRPRKCLVTHLSINILKSKFDEIYELLNEKLVDFLFISEAKIDSSFRGHIFEVQGYKLERRDRDLLGGGVAAFIRSDKPARRMKDLESKCLEI